MGRGKERWVDFRTLGRSGLVVSSFALGAMTFGREATEADARVQLDRFADAGGNLIDTADVYSSQASESIIGRWLASKPLHVRDQMVVATKGRFPTGGRGPNDHGLSRRHLSGALDASLRRLSVECIDLYQLHAYDPHTPISETLRFLSDAVSAGKIHYVGLSNFTGWQLQYVIDTARHSGFPQPLSLQMQYNLLTREVEWEMAPAALANGVGLLPWSPLGGGWLSGKYERNRQPELDTRLGDHRARRRGRSRVLDGAGLIGLVEQSARCHVGDPRSADASPAGGKSCGPGPRADSRGVGRAGGSERS
jgi:aryl-alcohol dehydrogenase-like predicted oxidoreductase